MREEPAPLETFTTRPQPRSTIPGTSAWQTRQGPSRFTRSVTVTVKLTKALRTLTRKARRMRVAAVAAVDAGAGLAAMVTLTRKKRW